MILFDKTRKTTLSLLGDVSEKQAKWLPAGEVNHILWHVGHIFVLLERCIFAATVGSDEMPAAIPEGWWLLFGWNSKPWEIDPEAWPSMASVKQRLKTQTDQLQHDLLGPTLEIYENGKNLICGLSTFQARRHSLRVARATSDEPSPST